MRCCDRTSIVAQRTPLSRVGGRSASGIKRLRRGHQGQPIAPTWSRTSHLEPSRFLIGMHRPLTFVTVSQSPDAATTIHGGEEPFSAESALSSNSTRSTGWPIRGTGGFGWPNSITAIHDPTPASVHRRERHRRRRINPLRGSSAGAAALAGDTTPSAAKRLAMAGSEVPAIDGPAGQGAADGAVVVLRSDPTRSATGVLVNTARARVQLGGGSALQTSRRRLYSRPSSHRCISSMSSTHWTMTRPAAGGTSSSRAPRRTLMSMHRLMALSMLCGCGSMSLVLRGGVGGERRRLAPGRHPPLRFRPASSSRRRGTHVRRSSRSAPVTEADRRRPRSPPRRCHWCEGRAERVRRHRGHASQLGGPARAALDGGGAGGRSRLRCRGVRRMAAGSARSVPRVGGPRRPGIAVLRAGETTMRAVAVFVGREVRGAAHRHYRPAAGSGR